MVRVVDPLHDHYNKGNGVSNVDSGRISYGGKGFVV